MPIRDLMLKNAKPAVKEYKISDGEGLYVLVKPNGSKLWRLKYRFVGKEKVLSFGAYPAVSIAEARERKNAAKLVMKAGNDPMVAKQRVIALDEDTFESIAKRWHANRETSLDLAHAARVWSRMERDVIPQIGSRQITQITPPDILSIVRKIEARGALDISRRAKQSISQVFRFAIANGWAQNDPTISLADALAPKPKVRHMPRVPLKELPGFLSKLQNYVEDGARRRTQTRDAIQFVLLTWVRTAEMRFALKSELENLDGDEPLWRIPAERMKQEREHLVPLSTQAAEIARRLVANSESNYVVSGEKPQKPLSENTMIYALYRMGYLGRQTVHGLRSLGSTWANEQLVEVTPSIWLRRYHEDWVELQLSHAEEDEVRGAYNAAEYLEPRRRMMQDWADFISGQQTR